MVLFLRIIHDINTRRSEDGFSKRGGKVIIINTRIIYYYYYYYYDLLLLGIHTRQVSTLSHTQPVPRSLSLNSFLEYSNKLIIDVF